MLPQRQDYQTKHPKETNTKFHSLVLNQMPLHSRILQRAQPPNKPSSQWPPPFPSNRNSGINNSPHNPSQDRLFPRRDLVPRHVYNGITVVIQERTTDRGAICCIAFDNGEVRDGRPYARGTVLSHNCCELGLEADHGDDGVVMCEERREEARAKVACRTEEEHAVWPRVVHFARERDGVRDLSYHGRKW